MQEQEENNSFQSVVKTLKEFICTQLGVSTQFSPEVCKTKISEQK